MKKEHPLKKEGYELVPDTSGKIVDSIWVKEDSLIIKFAWGPDLRFGRL